jgi:hypothetical protein
LSSRISREDLGRLRSYTPLGGRPSDQQRILRAKFESCETNRMIDDKADRFIYLDANVFIYFVEGAPELAEPIVELLVAAEGSFATGGNLHNLFITSELTLAEALASRTATDDDRQVYSELILESPAIFSAPIDRDILRSAADLRR